MAGLRDTLPRKQLIDRFGINLTFEEYDKTNLKIIAQKKPEGVFGIAANVWNRIVYKSWYPVDPLRFARYFQAADPNLHLAISKLVGREVIRDIYYVKGWRGAKTNSNLVVEMLVAWVYRSDLHLADITFIDPEQPIPKRSQKFSHQTHKGLGLLPILVDRLQDRAQEFGCQQLTLTAASRDQVPLFGRYGFVVEDSDSGRAAMKLGFGIPMERDL